MVKRSPSTGITEFEASEGESRATKEIVLDDRRRTSLARVGNKNHGRYLVEELVDGTLVLTPAVTVSAIELAVLRNPKMRASLDLAMTGDRSLLRKRRAPRP